MIGEGTGGQFLYRYYQLREKSPSKVRFAPHCKTNWEVNILKLAKRDIKVYFTISSLLLFQDTTILQNSI